jgi:hypothetical protein
VENVKKVIEPPRREGAKGFLFFLIGASLREASPRQAADREKNHALLD